MRTNFVSPEWRCPLNRGFPKERLHKWDRTGCFSLHVATLNSAKLIFCVKINFVRHQHDTERTKTERGRSRRQLFRPFGRSSVRRNKQRGSGVKFPHKSVLKVLWSWNVNLLFLGGRRSFIDPICRSFLHGFARISKVGFVHPIFSLWDINVTLGLLSSRWHVIWRDSVSVWVHVRALKQSVREFYGRASLFVAPYWRAPKRAKQLSTATNPLCFGSFSVVLMSYKLNFHAE